MKKPLLIDLAFGRAGTFMGIDTYSSRPEYINIKWIPFNSVKMQVIPDVPRSALQPVKTAHALVPKEGTYLLLTGTRGVSPVMEEFDLMRGSTFAQISELIARFHQAEAKSAVLQKQQQQMVEQVVDQSIDTVSKVAKAMPQPMGFSSRRRYPGAGGQLME